VNMESDVFLCVSYLMSIRPDAPFCKTEGLCAEELVFGTRCAVGTRMKQWRCSIGAPIMMMMITGAVAPLSRSFAFMAAEPRLRVMATTAASSRRQQGEKTEAAESIDDLEEPQRMESTLSAVAMEYLQDSNIQRARSRIRCGSAPPDRSQLEVCMRQRPTVLEQNTKGLIDNMMRESTLKERDSSIAEKKALARRAKRRA